MTLNLLSLIAQISPNGIRLPNKVNPGGSGGFVGSRLENALVISFGILGAIAVLVIVIASLQYVLSAGDSQKVAKAKDAIIYAVAGLVIAILAFAVIRFVLKGTLA